MYKKLLCWGVLFYALTLPVQAAVVVSINPAAPEISVGDSVGFSIDITGLDSSLALSGYELSLGFDPALLHFDSVIFGNQLDLAGQGQNFPNMTTESGWVHLIEFSFDDSAVLLEQQADNFTLANLYFTAIDSGVSSLNLSLHGLADSETNLIDANSQGAVVSITSAVPLPSGVWLFISGLGLLLRRQRLLQG
ncbi:MAG: cohesin domain-containing protein [Methylobacter sp.]|nr:cohesin domain-containing protein [Methylococcales bacterium]MDD5113963.1 cohesin domain-containing protein [Methylobacter sp.]